MYHVNVSVYVCKPGFTKSTCVWELFVRICLCDIICQHVLPCCGHNPAVTESRAGLWVEGSNFVTSLPGHSLSNLSRPLLAG